MAGQTSAILKGFDYQHLLSWYHILALKKDNAKVISVKLENSDAGYVDDLTVYKSDTSVDFYQVKYHTMVGNYSMENLLNAAEGLSLMEKFWTTWIQLIKTYPKDKTRLILYSNWVHHADDKILACINGENGQLTDSFFTASDRSDCGKKRKQWQLKHGASDQEFKEFTNSISFLLGRNFTDELKEVISERMELLNLKHDENSLLIASGIVKDWIKKKVKKIDRPMLEAKLTEHDLIQPADAVNSATVYFVTVKDRKFDVEPDYMLNWQSRFKEVGGRGGHELIEKSDWNDVMLPELLALESKVNSETAVRLIKARGYARLSPWLAFGHTFSEVSGYHIEVNQQDKLWRTDAKPNTGFKMISENGEGEAVTGALKTVAVGISITGSLESDVRSYLETEKLAQALLLLRPERELGNGCFQHAGDVTAFAKQSKEKIREFVKAQQADKLLLFYFGPLSGACFLGHQLNAVCNETQIMENAFGGYVPSFTLS